VAYAFKKPAAAPNRTAGPILRCQKRDNSDHKPKSKQKNRPLFSVVTDETHATIPINRHEAGAQNPPFVLTTFLSNDG
jgi:hypothetical protein